MGFLASVAAILWALGEPSSTVESLPRTLKDDYPGEASSLPVLEEPREGSASPEATCYLWDAQDKPRQEVPSREIESPHGSFSGFLQSHFSSTAWKETVWEGYLTQEAVLVPLALAAGAAAVSPWDRRLSRRWNGALGRRSFIGNTGQYVLIGAPLLAGLFFPGPGRNSWDELWCEGEAFAASALTTESLKGAVRRRRPEITGGRGNSFPSGHTSAAFTGATLIQANSGYALGIPAVAIAALTGFSRIESRKHFPSDVLAGAAIGVLSANILDVLHWGTGPEGKGIARPPAEFSLQVGEGRGLVLGLSLEF
jgi:membrane-associated phospholipid phosphatase